ncbi:MAG: glycosyltransferase family 87 protein [Bacteroidota bacterium]
MQNVIGIRILKYLVVCAVGVYCFLQANSGGDFKIFLGAAELLKNGENCYNVWIHLGGDNYCGYSYSPIFATFLVPFTYFPWPIVPLLWLILNIFFLNKIKEIIIQFLPIDFLGRRDRFLFGFICLIVSIRFVLHNFEMIQMTIFILYCCLESLRQAQKGKLVKSGLLLAIGIMVKLIPIVVIPYFVYRRHFKPVFITLFFIGLMLVFPSIIFGWEFNALLLSDWIDIVNPNNSEFLSEQNKIGEGIHGLSGFLAGFFTLVGERSGFSRCIHSLSTEQLSFLLNSCRIALILLTIYFLRKPPFIRMNNPFRVFWEFSYILCITPLIFPHQQKYAFLLICPALIYCIYHLFQVKVEKGINTSYFRIRFYTLVLIFILTTLTTDGLIGKYASKLSQYYKLITFGVFLLIPLLLLSKPKNSINSIEQDTK